MPANQRISQTCTEYLAFEIMAAERGRDLIEIYGSYPVSKTFAVTDNVPGLADTDMPTYSAAFDVDPTTTKRHAACDECSEFAHEMSTTV